MWLARYFQGKVTPTAVFAYYVWFEEHAKGSEREEKGKKRESGTESQKATRTLNKVKENHCIKQKKKKIKWRRNVTFHIDTCL